MGFAMSDIPCTPISEPTFIIQLRKDKSKIEEDMFRMFLEVNNLNNHIKNPQTLESNKISAEYVLEKFRKEYHETQRKLKKIDDEIRRFVEKSILPDETTDELVFPPYDFDSLLKMPAKEWLLDQVFGPGDLGMIYGLPGCGKTFVVIDMIIKICKGEQWAHRFKSSRPMNVAYCAGEGLSALPARFATAAAHHKNAKLSNFTFFKNTPQLYDDESSGFSTIVQFINEWKRNKRPQLDVLVIDTLHTASEAADENSSTDMGNVLKSCRMASNELGCAVILVHHTNKGGTSERGSSSLRGAMDFMISVTPVGENGTNAVISCSKLKDGERWKDQAFNLSPIEGYDSVHVCWNTVESGEPPKNRSDAISVLKQEMERDPGKRFSSKSLSETISQNTVNTIKILNTMIDRGLCQKELTNPEKAATNRNPWLYFI